MAGSEFSVMGIVVTIITVGVGAAIGLIVLSQVSTVFYGMNNSDQAIQAFNSTMDIIYNSIPLIGLVVLALIATLILGVFMWMR